MYKSRNLRIGGMPTLFEYYLKKRKYTDKKTLAATCIRLKMKEKVFKCPNLMHELNDLMYG